MHLDIGSWISQYGYIGIFLMLLLEMIGIPFPGETALTVSGIEWTQGVFSLVPLIIFAVLGNVIGSSIAFGIGRFLGRAIILRFGAKIKITESKLHAVEKKFEKYGVSIIFFAKFIAGIRVMVPYLAGINRMSFLTFSIYNTLSAIVWTVAFIFLGQSLSVMWDRYNPLIREFGGTILAVGGIVVIGYVAVKHRNKGAKFREKKNPREMMQQQNPPIGE